MHTILTKVDLKLARGLPDKATTNVFKVDSKYCHCQENVNWITCYKVPREETSINLNIHVLVNRSRHISACL